MFGRIKGIWNETRGNLLRDQLTDALQKLHVADPRLQLEFRLTAKALFDQVNQRLFNMSPEGRLKLGKALQSQARMHFDLQGGRAHAEWIVGAWLESANLPGQSAAEVCKFLSEFLEGLYELQTHNTPTSRGQNQVFENSVSDREILEAFGDFNESNSDSLAEINTRGAPDYGWDSEEPISVCGIPDAYLYLSRLRTLDGAPIRFERKGSLTVDGYDNLVDEYVIFDLNGNELGCLYIFPYGTSNPNKCPEGLKLI